MMIQVPITRTVPVPARDADPDGLARQRRVIPLGRAAWHARDAKPTAASSDAPGCAWSPVGASFRIALGSQPVYAAASRQPVVDVGFALEPLDVPDFGPGVMSFNQPVALFDPL